MKDFLNYYYFILPNKIYMVNNNYYFKYKDYNFVLYLYNGNNIKDLYNLNNYMLLNNLKINKIIINKEGNILSIKNNKAYCLVELFYNNNINIKDIVYFSKRVNLNIINRTNWKALWSLKIDNIEYNLSHLKNKYKLLYNSSFYYIGLTENAISLLNYYSNNTNIGICHNRITDKDFYNPLNIIIDYRVRDIAEYFKYLFFCKNIDIKEIISLFNNIKMNNLDYIYFYIRMLYPSYYFDMVDNIINNKVSESKLNNIISRIDDYEYLLYKLFLLINNNTNIMSIEWINKKFAI